MEFVDGGQVNDRDYMERNKIDVNEISCHLGKMYSEMIFVNGFVHCDPHPGNVLVRKRPDTGKAEIVLLDHGLYQVLTDEFRLDYCHLWQSLIWTDMEKVKKYSQRLGAGELYPLFACMLTARSWHSVNKGIGQASVTATESVSWPDPCRLAHSQLGLRRGPAWTPPRSLLTTRDSAKIDLILQ
ncbi:uncharacterized aarF domain-containing protein kinase 1-like [Leptonychotes weddellii]|uniref:AarF domain-containing protein kinase 1 n=1 Tax=Leptonychotes weddellii TaxID=9713 RepID=A0A7F8Q779_LEPWE|nr:uncharacterized aarF domain-containing protein kinase 1-like [Leptonychotes weddellii]